MSLAGMTNELRKDEYRCSMCKGVFSYGWSEGEAHDELKKNFGDIDVDDCEIVCDGCYQKIMGGPDDGRNAD